MFLTKERFNQLREEKKQLIAEYKALRSERSRLSEEFTGYEEKQVAIAGINEDLERVSHEIERMEELLETVELVEPEEHIDDVVHLGDIVTIEYDDDDRFTFKLVTSVTNLEEIGETVSIDSPLGKAVYLKQLGDNSSYEVKKNKFNFTIVELKKS